MLISIACQASWMNASITSSRRRAIITCILNTFARRLLYRVNGVLMKTYINDWGRQHSLRRVQSDVTELN